jgi:hypothetical protein
MLQVAAHVYRAREGSLCLNRAGREPAVMICR